MYAIRSAPYLKDYRMDLEIDASGKEKQVLVYVGDYHVLNEDEKTQRAKRFLPVFTLIGWIAFVGSLFFYSEITKCFYVLLPYMLYLFSLYFISVADYYLCFFKKKYTNKENDSVVNRGKAATVGGIAIMILTSVGEVAFFVKHQEVSTYDFLFLSLSVVEGISFCLSFAFLKDVDTHVVENPEKNRFPEEISNDITR